MNKPIVIKFGGEVVETPEQLSNLATSVAKLHTQGENIILVHGGGPIANKLSKRLEIEPNMVGGRRVTCEKTLEVMKMVLPGIVNSNVLALLKSHNLPGVSASGISFVEAITRPKKAVSGSNGEKIDFGYVGDILSVDPTFLNSLIEKRYIPVVSPLCADQDGKQLNINADTVSVQIAKACEAKNLVLITSIGGVFKDIDDKKSKYKDLTIDQAKELIKTGIIQGGMIPKLEEGFKLLDGKLNGFHIVGTDSPDSIINEITTPGSEGTAIVKS